ncbi:MAG TPA: Glu-tRNA(Gln) amidotransferase subunit GatD [Nanoarchaeota archaeon]|nr:Glu-tRNA(Gln) amidotransferase subunit GatD [Nanoarchaeota archaeon]
MAKVGDRVKVQSSDTNYEGTVIPSSDKQKDVLMLKLNSGYNIGIKIDKNTKINIIGEFSGIKASPPEKYSHKPGLPNVTLIATGGTIGSKVDYKTGAVHMLMSPDELIANVPELTEIVNLKKILRPFSLASEDMSSAEWQKIAEEVEKELNSGADGVIVTHGTDTLHYTGAALSFMLKNLSKPIAIVGGQRSSDRGSFDGAMNLICAAHYCKSNIAEVAIIMHAEPSDSYCFAIRGTKARKMHTSRRDAFRPINDLPFAKIWKDGRIEIINKNFRERKDTKVSVESRFENKIALIKYFPGADPAILDYFVKEKYKGMIIEATGLGHVAVQPLNKKNSWLGAIKNAIAKGVLVCFAPQTIYGRLDPFVYSNARMLHDAGVLYLGDMLPETAYVKLGHVLAYEKHIEQAKKMMLENMAGEINEKISEESFLY